MCKTIGIAFLCFFFTFPCTIYAQVCQGNFGDPIVYGRYDRRVANDQNDLSSSSYIFSLSTILFETVVPKELCPNTTYEFSSWAGNLITSKSIKSNLTFSILTLDNKVLCSYNTGDIGDPKEPSWKQYGSLFNIPDNINRVKLRISNNKVDNNLFLNDILFRACEPKINTFIDQPDEIEKTICEGQESSLTLSANLGGLLNRQCMWQRNDGSGWADLINNTSLQMLIETQSLPAGTFQYRLLAAEPNHLNSPTCRITSSSITIHVKPSLKPIITNQETICRGNAIALGVTGVDGTYAWTGPNNYHSTAKSPIIENAALNMTGNYQVTVSSGNCSAQANINILVVPPPLAKIDNRDIHICAKAPIRLQASGGTTYKWAPAEGLSATNIANPVASPDTTTLYHVTVSNGSCENTAEIIVNVFKKALAITERKSAIMEGQSIALNAKVSGDMVRQFWTPSDYLDDPTKLNPIATPPHDMTYVLNVWSEKGCKGSTSSVFIKVYKKLVIPNAISPNGDGINDEWNIEALEAYPNAELRIINRYGEKVFESISSSRIWDGKYKGADLPVGTYYYTLNLHNGQKNLSGSITILR